MNPQNGVNLGSAHGDITIGNNIDSALDSATRSFDNALSRIGDSISRAGAAMTSAGTAISIAMLPVEKLFVDAINTASNYEDALKEIEARAGLTAEELAMVSDKALQLGADTSFSAQQAADAFLQLMSSGSSLEEAMVQIDAVMAGAAANGAELGYTADALTDVMAAFGLETSHSAEVMQALTAAASSSSATFEDLVAGFANVGPVAKNMGMSVEETAAALAVFSENGIKGAEAGTQLRTMLTNMTRQTDDVQGMWQRLGVSMVDAQGNMRDLDDVIKDLNVAMEGMSDQERNEVITTLAGSYGQVGLSALLAADGIDEMNASMAEQGSMEEIAAARMDTYSGAVDAAMGSLETLSIRVMTPFMEEVLKPTIKYITELINQVSDWAAANEPLVMTMLKVLSVLFAVGPVLIALGVALQVIGPAVAALGVAMGFLISPITLVIAAVGALAYVFRDQLGAAVQTGMGWLSAFGDFIGYFVSDVQNSGLGEAILAIFGQGNVGSVVGSSLGGLLQQLGFSVDAAQEITDDVFGVFSHWFIKIKNIFASVGSMVAGPFRKIQDSIAMFFSSLRVGQPVLSAFTSAMATVFGNVDWTQAGLDILNGLGSALNMVGSWAAWLYDNLLGPMLANMAMAVASVDWAGVGSAILSGLGSALNTLGIWATWIYDNLFAPMLGSVATAIGSVDWSQVGMFILQGLGDALKTLSIWATWIYDNLLAPMLGSVATAIASVEWSQIGMNILQALGDSLKTLGIWATWVYDNLLVPLFSNAATAVASVDWTQVGISILTGIGNALKTLGTWAVWVYENLLVPMVSNIATAVMSVDWIAVGTSILDALGSALVTMGSWVTWIYDNLLAPIPANAAAAIASVDWQSVGENVVYAIGDYIKNQLDFVAWMIDSIFNPMTASGPGATEGSDWTGVGDAIMGAIASALVGFFSFSIWLIDTIFEPLIAGASAAINETDWSSVGANLMAAIGRAIPNIQQWVQNNIIDPITNALGGFDPMAALGFGGPTMITSPSYNAPNGGTGSAGVLRDSGGAGYPGVAYMIGTGAQPEMYIPDSPGTFIPNADQMGSKNFNINIESITAATMAEARDLGNAFGDALMNKIHNSGFAEGL